MSYEIPYDSNYGEWYGQPQNVTRLSATLEQSLDEDGYPIGIITASWNMPDNGGTFVAQLSTDGTNYHIAETNIRQNSVTLTVESNTDYYLKIVTVLDGEQSSGVVSSLLSSGVTIVPPTPTVVAVQGGMQINVGSVPFGYNAVISISDGTDTTVLYTTNMITIYNCDAGTYSVSTAYANASNDVGTSSSSVSVTVSELATADDYVEKTSADYIKSASVSGSTLTLTKGNDTTVTFSDTDTTYSAGTGLSLNGTTFNNDGVLSVSEGSTNGTISVDGTDVAVHGLGSRAYDSTSYLPLAGGTMTGSIISSNQTAIKRSVDNSNMLICGGTDYTKGAYLAVSGKDRSGVNSGVFELIANNGTNSKILFGKPDGTFTWNGSNILTASNYNSYALPLSGGTMTGAIVQTQIYAIKRDVDDDRLYIFGGTDYNKGAYLSLYGKDHSTNPSEFNLIAHNGTTGVTLKGKLDGTLTWNGSNILTASNYNSYALPLSGGTMTGGISSAESVFVFFKTVTTGDTRVYGGSNTSNGAYLVVYGKDNTGRGGRFSLTASDGTNTSALDGRPDGTLKWGGKLLSAPSGRILTASGTVAAVQDSFVDITSVVLDKSISDKWFVFAHVKISESVNSIISMTLGGSSFSAVRFNGGSGGGAVNGIVKDITANTTYKLSAYTSVSNQFNYIGTMWAIPLM